MSTRRPSASHPRRRAAGSAPGRAGRRPRPSGSVGHEHHFLVYRRTWRGLDHQPFLSPLLFLLSMGLGLGSLVDTAPAASTAVPYLLFVVPGILAMQAMTTAMGESSWPVLGVIKWNRIYHAMLATPLRVVDMLGGHRAFVAFHLVHRGGDLHGRRGAVRRLRLVVGAARLPVAVLAGLAFAVPDLRPVRPARERHRVQHPLPVRPHAADALLRHLLPDRPAAGVAAAARLGHPALARRRAVPRRRHRHRSRLARAGAPGGAAASRRGRLGARPRARSPGGWSRERRADRRAAPRASLPFPAGLGLAPATSSSATSRPSGTPGCCCSPASSSRCSTCSRSASGSARSSGTSPPTAAARCPTRCSSPRRCSPSSAMNGAIFDSTFNVFFKLKYSSSTTPCWRRRSVRATSPSARSPGR